MAYRSLVLAGSSYNYVADPATTITPTNENSLFPKALLVDGRMANPFRFSTDGTDRIIQFNLGSSRAVDFLGIFGHNIVSTVTSVTVQWSPDGSTGWTTFMSCDPEQPTFYIYRGAGSLSKQHWRVVFFGNNSGAAIWIGELVLGLATVLTKNPNYPVRCVAAEANISTDLPNGDSQETIRTMAPQRRLEMSFQGSRADHKDAYDVLYTPSRGSAYSAVFVPQADDDYDGSGEQVLLADQHLCLLARLDKAWPYDQHGLNVMTWRVGATEQAYPQPMV